MAEKERKKERKDTNKQSDSANFKHVFISPLRNPIFVC